MILHQVKREPVKRLRNDLHYFLLSVPCIANYNRTERSFTYAGPHVWNFKAKLKTHLFREVFM